MFVTVSCILSTILSKIDFSIIAALNPTGFHEFTKWQLDHRGHSPDVIATRKRAMIMWKLHHKGPQIRPFLWSRICESVQSIPLQVIK